ncbi:TNF receptor-associated factor 2-like [Ornithodoros turicata]|uniref:TNF receptor-associated factor 2-like n=1 Tax=Ornithodoros turicata TaxID=34597 RepID=UPI0031396AEB
MSAERYLVGFSEALDWRPMHFVDLRAVPACSLCGMVPKETFELDCLHSLCPPCYQGVCGHDRKCPIDDETFQQSNVRSVTLKATLVQQLNVGCPNSKQGCDFVGSVERMQCHFLQDCAYHVTTCKTCGDRVIGRDMVRHLREQCATRRASRGGLPGGSMFEMIKHIKKFTEGISDILRAIEARQDSHTDAIDSTKECVAANGEEIRKFAANRNEPGTKMFHTIVALAVACFVLLWMRNRDVTEQLAALEEKLSCRSSLSAGKTQTEAELLATILQHQERLANDAMALCVQQKQSHAETLQIVKNHNEQMQKRIEELPIRLESTMLNTSERSLLKTTEKLNYMEGVLHILSGSGSAFFHVKDFAETKKRLMTRDSESFVLHGYCAKLQIDFRVSNGWTYLGLYVRFCSSPRDSLLRWPANVAIALTLVHPRDHGQDIDETFSIFVPRPSPDVSYGSPRFAKVEDIERHGLIHEDAITVAAKIRNDDAS